MTIENNGSIATKPLDKSKLKQNFGLTEERFEVMLQNMQNGDETLFERVFLTQFEESINYLMFNYKINRSTAYDVTMDALLKFRKRLIAGKISYGNMRFLFTRMAGQFLSDSHKSRTVEFDGSELLNETIKNNIDDSVLDALDQAWLKLCKDCSTILKQFYYQKIALKTLAQKYEKTEGALRKQKQRCLDKLRIEFLKFYSK